MSIKEIIDKEYWPLDSRDAYEHNASLERIEAAVAEHTKRLDSVFAQVEQSFIDRIIRLEDRLVDANKTIEALKKQTSMLDLNQKPF